MSFAYPQYLLLLIAAPIAAGVVFWSLKRRADALARIGNPALVSRLTMTVNTRARIARGALAVAAIAMVAFALARPQWGESAQIVERQGLQLMIALDVSRSMLAEDRDPNRLSHAKLEIIELMSLLRGDEVGLLLFAGTAKVQFPLTFDYSTARVFLDAADTTSVSNQGTALAAAISGALIALADDRPSRKVILIVSDGEDHERAAIDAAKKAADAGVMVYAIGIGSSEGQPIPVRDRLGNRIGYLQDSSDGRMVLTRLDKNILREVAAAGGGKLIEARGSESAAQLFAKELGELDRITSESEVKVGRVERFQIFAAAAILLVLLGELIAERRTASLGAPPSQNLWRRTLALLRFPKLFLFGLVLAAALALALTALGCGRYSPVTALAEREGPAAIEQGNAAFEGDRLGDAKLAYERAVAEMPDRVEPLYNLANTLYEQGDTESAKELYRQILLMDPNNADTRHNLEVALNSEPTPTPTPEPEDDEQQQQQPSQESEQQGEDSQEEQPQEQAGDQNSPPTAPGEPQDSPSEEGQQEGDQGEEPSQTPGDELADDGQPIQPSEPSASLTEDEARRLLQFAGEEAGTQADLIREQWQPPLEKNW